MALVNCIECDKEISDKASSCPHCGYPMIEKTDVSITNEKDNKTSISNENNSDVKDIEIIGDETLKVPGIGFFGGIVTFCGFMSFVALFQHTVIQKLLKKYLLSRLLNIY